MILESLIKLLPSRLIPKLPPMLYYFLQELPMIAVFRTLRQNHALEHATIHVLTEYGCPPLMGHSEYDGFSLYGNLPTEIVSRAVQEAFSRLQRGETRLAEHPRCGTQFVTRAMLFAGALSFAMTPHYPPKKTHWIKAAIAIGVAGLLSRATGRLVQRHITTDHTLKGLTLGAITCYKRGGLRVHRIQTLPGGMG